MDYKNILVINLMHIGDLMLVTPALRTLRTNFPGARITLLADKKLRELVEENPCIDECLLLDKKGADDGFLPLARFIHGIRRRRFDLVINLHRNERASAIAAFSGAKRIVGYAKPFFSLFFTKVLENYAMPGTPKEKTLHQVEAHFRVLREAVGIERIDDRGLELVLPGKARAEAERIFAEHFEPGETIVAFNIGASWLTKRWLEEYFAKCADALLARGLTVAFFGGPGDEGPVAECISHMEERESPHLHVFTGKVSLGTLAGLLRHAAIFLTTDSGPMHVGVAMNVPVVTMFGASPVPTFYPYDGRSILVKTPEECHPCGLHECPRKGEGYMGCMKHMPPEIILKYVDELLAKYQGRPALELAPHLGDYKCRVIEL